MTDDQTTRDAVYAMGYTEDELHRLPDQGQLYASSTRALLLDAGIGPGMRVLDVGCGPGDVSLLVAERVSPTGEVVGVDTNDRVLRLARARASASGATHVRFVQTDLRELRVDTLFDAVVGRFVLMYLADPADVVHRVARYVCPGGVVAFQEFQFEFTPLGSASLPLFEQFRSWGLAVFSTGWRRHQHWPEIASDLSGRGAARAVAASGRVHRGSWGRTCGKSRSQQSALSASPGRAVRNRNRRGGGHRDLFAAHLAELNTSGAVHVLPRRCLLGPARPTRKSQRNPRLRLGFQSTSRASAPYAASVWTSAIR
jgi:2-polyprenyl-3-methyl-5-hydroxy-6-metoxy-1,4-benzoquinol methylase